ncbi:MAG: PilN domain-containing protein [Undibacterium sp.]|nr:PilN domain-containing protein [Undibacterium sp.]
MSQQINLYDPRLLKQKEVLTSSNIVGAFALSLALVAGIWGYLVIETSKQEQLLSQQTARVSVLTAQVTPLREMVAAKSKNPIYEKELRTIETAIQKRENIAQILRGSDFGDTGGYSGYLAAFAKQIPAGVWLTGFSLEGAGFDISIQGRAMQPAALAVYINQLKREKVMQGKTFAALQMNRPQIAVVASTASSALAPTSSTKSTKTEEDAPYIEFELRSTEAKEKSVAGAAVAAPVKVASNGVNSSDAVRASINAAIAGAKNP